MVVVEDGVRERAGESAELFDLGEQVQHAVLDVLQQVGLAVRPVEVHVALLLAHERLVAFVVEEFPGLDQTADHADVRAGLDVEVAGVEVPAHVQPGDGLERLVVRAVGLHGRVLPLEMPVEVVARGRLQVALLEGLAVPDAVRLVHGHVVHVDGDPDVARGVGHPVVDRIVDDEVAGAVFAVADVVDAGVLHLAEVELHVVVLVVRPPGGGPALVDELLGAVVVDAEDGGVRDGLVVLVDLDHGDLRLRGDVSDLREPDVRLADPAGDGVRLDGPGHDLAGLLRGQDAAEHVPAVLREDAAVVEFERGVGRGDLDHAFGLVGGDHDGPALLERERVDELARAAVVVGAEALILAGLLLVRHGLGIAHGVTREAVVAAVHDVRLAPILRGEEFEVEPGLALQELGQRRVEVDRDLDRRALAGDHDARGEIVVGEAHRDLDGVGRVVDPALRRLRDQVPLLRRLGETHRAALHGPHAVMDDLDARVLLVVEPAGEGVAEHEHVHARPFEILPVVQDELLRVERLQGCLDESLLRLPLTLPLLAVLAVLPVLALTDLLLLRLILPGLLGLSMDENGGQREERGHDEGGTGAKVHADDPCPADETALVLGVVGRVSPHRA